MVMEQDAIKPGASPVAEIFRQALPGRIANYEEREQQIAMALQVERALRQGGHLLVEAGTGTGKSFAYLIPLALSLGQTDPESGEERRGVVSTATISLQEQLLKKDIPFLEEALGLDFRARLAKGKGNYLCLLRSQEELSSRTLVDDGVRERLREWVKDTATGDRSELDFDPGELWGRICPDDTCPGRQCYLYDDCYSVKARASLQNARLVVCNHALFFTDLMIRGNSGGYASLLPDYQAVVFDEGQHVEKVARETMSTQVSNLRLPVILYQLRKREGCHLESVQKALRLNDSFFAAVATGGTGDKYVLPPDPPFADTATQLMKAVKDNVLLFDNDSIGEREQALFNCLGRYNEDLKELQEVRHQNRVYWVETGHGRRLWVNMHATPLDIAPDLERLLFDNQEIGSVIMTSATLSTGGNFQYLKKTLGCQQANETLLQSPFDYSRQCLLYLPEGLPDPKQPDFHESVAHFIEELLHCTEGRAFVLFTSYQGMYQVYDRLAGRLPWNLLKQGDKPRHQLLEEFKEDTHSVLLATASFWEGVDVQGEALSCVILVKLPFAVPDDPITEARMQAIAAAGDNPFLTYTLPQAIIRFKQGFGRLIRNRSDRGVVAVLDPRIKSKQYGKLFLRSLPHCRQVADLDQISDFFQPTQTGQGPGDN